jgi:hypothetical protein
MTGVVTELSALARRIPAQSRTNARQFVIVHFTHKGSRWVPLGDRLMSTETEAGLGWEEGRKEILEWAAAIVRPARSEEKITA